MYASYLREVPKEYYIRHRNIFKNDVYFNEMDEVLNLREFIEQYGASGLQEIFDIIGVKYDSINESGPTYKLNNKMLHIQELSSGERSMLYLMIMEKLKKPLIMIGVFDRLDRDHRERLVNALKNTDAVTLSWGLTTRNCDVYDDYYKPFEDLIKEGII